jgi:hypothetical protein
MRIIQKPRFSFISDFTQHLKDDFEHRRHVFFLELVGSICIISSDLCVTTLTDKTPFLITFPIYLIGSFSMICASYFRKIGFSLVLYIVFYLIYFCGLMKLMF